MVLYLKETPQLVAHNAPFDMGVLKKRLYSYGIQWMERATYLCTVQIGRSALPGMRPGLGDMCDYYGIELDHHKADSDSHAAGEILLRYMGEGMAVERIVADYFVQKRINNDYVPPKDELVHVEAVLQLLSVLTNDRRFEDSFNEARTAGKEVRNMCDVLDRVEMRGREEGREEGLEKGADRAFTLMQMLFADGRSDDAVRAANDKEYARQLMKEYKLV